MKMSKSTRRRQYGLETSIMKSGKGNSAFKWGIGIGNTIRWTYSLSCAVSAMHIVSILIIMFDRLVIDTAHTHVVG